MVYTTGRSYFKVFPCSLSLCFSIPFSILITSLREKGAGLCASRAFVCFVRLSDFPILSLLVSGLGCGLLLWHSLNFSINFSVYKFRKKIMDVMIFLINLGK